jgi:hypothetical protein
VAASAGPEKNACNFAMLTGASFSAWQGIEFGRLGVRPRAAR